MPAGGAGHDRERHQADRARGPGVDTGGARYDRGPQGGGAQQQKAERHEAIADVEDENERLASGAVAGPARQAHGVENACQEKRPAGGACYLERRSRPRGR